MIGGYQQCKEHGGSIVNLPDGARRRIFNAGNDDELEAQDLTGLGLISIKGKAELVPIAPMDLMDSLDLNKKTTKNDNEN